MKTLVKVIRELTVAIKSLYKLHKHTSNCGSCKCPSIEVRFRLMESAYHEDMNEVYQRLTKLELK